MSEHKSSHRMSPWTPWMFAGAGMDERSQGCMECQYDVTQKQAHRHRETSRIDISKGSEAPNWVKICNECDQRV
jgi:hypothetical protein